MKIIIFSLLILFKSVILFSQNTWTQKADYPGGEIYFGNGFVIGEKAYVGPGGTGLEFWEYDPLYNQWTQISDMPLDPYQFRSFAIGNYGYIIAYMYIASVSSTEVWQYDPSTNQWIQKNDFLGEARMDGIAFNIGTKGYYGLGNPSAPYMNDMWEYNPDTDQWTQICDFPVGRRAATAFSIGNKGYVGLGGAPSLMNDFWEYDPSNNTWTQKADFGGTGRQFSVGFSINGKGYIGTGYDEIGNYTKDFWEYDTVSDTWTQMTDFGGPKRQGAVGFSINNKGYITTGYDGTGWVTAYDDLWEYTPNTNNIIEKNKCIQHKIYPNPSDGVITIDCKLSVKSEIRILNIQGKRVFNLTKTKKNEIQIDISHLNSGIYILEIISNHNVYREKIIME